MTLDFSRLDALNSTTWLADGGYADAIQSGLSSLCERDAQKRIWGRDGTLWRDDPGVAEQVEQRLGWLALPDDMRIQIDRLRALSLEVEASSYDTVVLLGMGGSSLAPEVYHEVIGVAQDACKLIVLDTTDPAQIMRVRADLDLEHTLFVIASKSGTTAEPLSLMAYFCQELQSLGEGVWPQHFMAITDPGTPLRVSAEDDGMRALYLNPPDIGGRYSGLSLFGLAPAALMGTDVEELLDRARVMMKACAGPCSLENPGLALGVWMGAMATLPTDGDVPRRDKLTMITSPELAAFGAWVEQLIAESTGKEGKGILPIEGEALTAESELGNDRAYAYLRLGTGDNAEKDALVQALVDRGEPVIVLSMPEVMDLGAEFFRWEYATAVAGLLMGINPFDQPNVESAKLQARAAIEAYSQTHSLPENAPIFSDDLAAIDGPELGSDQATIPYLTSFLRQAKPGGYVALMAYVDRSAENEMALQALRMLLEERLSVPVTVGYGPRFLHSTGQLHKGGAEGGLFVQLTHDVEPELAIPGQSYTFQVLQRSQALGDLAALRESGRQAVRVHLADEQISAIEALSEGLANAL